MSPLSPCRRAAEMTPKDHSRATPGQGGSAVKRRALVLCQNLFTRDGMPSSVGLDGSDQSSQGLGGEVVSFWCLTSYPARHNLGSELNRTQTVLDKTLEEQQDMMERC